MEGSVSPSPTPSPSPGRETWRMATWQSGHHPGPVTLRRRLSGTACRGLWEDIWHLINYTGVLMDNAKGVRRENTRETRISTAAKENFFFFLRRHRHKFPWGRPDNDDHRKSRSTRRHSSVSMCPRLLCVWHLRRPASSWFDGEESAFDPNWLNKTKISLSNVFPERNVWGSQWPHTTLKAKFAWTFTNNHLCKYSTGKCTRDVTQGTKTSLKPFPGSEWQAPLFCLQRAPLQPLQKCAISNKVGRVKRRSGSWTES